MNTPALALVDGKVVPIEDAKIPISDNGYLLGDGVFETMRTKHDGSLFRPELHLARASKGLRKILIETDISELFLESAEVLRKEAVKQIGSYLYIRINLSSGSGYRWSAAPDLKVTGIAKPLEKAKADSLNCVVWRRYSEKYELSNTKSLSYARSAAMRRQVNIVDKDDIIIVNDNDMVVEASIGNLIARKGSMIYAPGAESGALNGTTRQIIIEELIDKSTHQIQEQVSLKTLYECDEVMLTSSLSGVRRVSQIEQIVYDQNILFEKLSKSYENLLN